MSTQSKQSSSSVTCATSSQETSKMSNVLSSVPAGKSITTSVSETINSAQQQGRDTSHAWEAVDGSSMWTDVQEDSDGNILLGSSSNRSLAAQIRQRRHRLASTDLARSTKRLVRHMLRHVYLVLDISRWSREKDPALPPARLRLETTISLANDFVDEFYDQNPLGHLGVILCQDGEAEMLTTLGCNPKKHKLALAAALVTEMKKRGGAGSKNDVTVGGEFSLQNGIEVAGRSLGYSPRYGSREVIVLTSALATCDPGNILSETLPRLLHAGIRVSTVALQAELYICKKLAESTGGVAGVCMDSRHLRDLVMSHVIPPPVNASQYVDHDNPTNHNSNNLEIDTTHCEFVTMGFPSKDGGDVPTLVHSTGGSNNKTATFFSINPAAADDRRSNRLIVFARSGYVCPKCRSHCSDLPADCAVCGLRLILAPHLARTFHHLFPVRPFLELDEAQVVSIANNYDKNPSKQKNEMNGEMKNGKNGLECLTNSEYASNSSISPDQGNFIVSSSIVTKSLSTHDNDSKESKVINIGPSLMVKSTDCDRCCFGCLKIIGCRSLLTATENESESILRFQCPECKNVFCPDCDAFLHETLHNCPGCLSS